MSGGAVLTLGGGARKGGGGMLGGSGPGGKKGGIFAGVESASDEECSEMTCLRGAQCETARPLTRSEQTPRPVEEAMQESSNPSVH